jgi:hypothetical protein
MPATSLVVFRCRLKLGVGKKKKNLAVLKMEVQEMVTVHVTALDLGLANPWEGEKYSVELERSDTSVAQLIGLIGYAFLPVAG